MTSQMAEDMPSPSDLACGKAVFLMAVFVSPRQPLETIHLYISQLYTSHNLILTGWSWKRFIDEDVRFITSNFYNPRVFLFAWETHKFAFPGCPPSHHKFAGQHILGDSKQQIPQGSLHDTKPNFVHYQGEIPHNYHTFASSLIPPQIE